MTLQFSLDANGIKELDEKIRSFYVEKDGKFVLDVTGYENADDRDRDQQNRIPLTRLNQEIEKRKQTEAQLEELATAFIDNVPEEMRDLIPDLPSGQKIKWIQGAARKGLFEIKKHDDGIDTRRPGGGKPPADFANMDPRARMASGYKTK